MRPVGLFRDVLSVALRVATTIVDRRPLQDILAKDEEKCFDCVNRHRGSALLPLLATSTKPLEPGETRAFFAEPQRAFRVHRLIVESSSGDDGVFTLSKFLVGADPQIVSREGAMPGSAFSSKVAVPIPLKGTVVVPGIDVYINVTNVSDKPQQFFAVVIGDPIS